MTRVDDCDGEVTRVCLVCAPPLSGEVDQLSFLAPPYPGERGPVAVMRSSMSWGRGPDIIIVIALYRRLDALYRRLVALYQRL